MITRFLSLCPFFTNNKIRDGPIPLFTNSSDMSFVLKLSADTDSDTDTKH